jgi:hypothetical protein
MRVSDTSTAKKQQQQQQQQQQRKKNTGTVLSGIFSATGKGSELLSFTFRNSEHTN